jgi:hypothetical protein
MLVTGYHAWLSKTSVSIKITGVQSDSIASFMMWSSHIPDDGDRDGFFQPFYTADGPRRFY